jgi:hypothetical protein
MHGGVGSLFHYDGYRLKYTEVALQCSGRMTGEDSLATLLDIVYQRFVTVPVR